MQSSEGREELEEILLRHTPDPPSTPIGTPQQPKFPFPKPLFPGGKPPSDTVSKRTPRTSKNPTVNKPKESFTKKDSGTPSINGQQCVACGLYQQSKNIKKKHFLSTHNKEYPGPYWIKPVTRKKLKHLPSHLRVDSKEYRKWKKLDKEFYLNGNDSEDSASDTPDSGDSNEDSDENSEDSDTGDEGESDMVEYRGKTMSRQEALVALQAN